MPKKILFINAVNPTSRIETAYSPLGLGYLASALRAHFGRDYFEFKVVNDGVAAAIDDFKPDIVGITSVSQNYGRACEYARIAKQAGLPVIIGGMHITALPQTMTEDMDIAVLGEGEETICEVVEAIEDKRNIYSVHGIIINDGKLPGFATDPRPPIKPLDKLDFPARDILTIGKTAHMFTSRGCPYSCRFCSSSRFWKGLRFFSAGYVVSEIKSLIETYHVNHIEFWDDLFIADRTRLKESVKIIEQSMIDKAVSFTCNCRSNLVDEELCELLCQLNVKNVGMGFESGCPRTLAYLKGDNISIESHERALELLRRYGINPHVSFIIGSPSETKAEVMETYDFIKHNHIKSFDVYALTPFPGTPIWDYAAQKGLVSEQMDWSRLNVNFGENWVNSVNLSGTLSTEEIYNLYKKFKWQRLKNPRLFAGAILAEIKKRAGG